MKTSVYRAPFHFPFVLQTFLLCWSAQTTRLLHRSAFVSSHVNRGVPSPPSLKDQRAAKWFCRRKAAGRLGASTPFLQSSVSQRAEAARQEQTQSWTGDGGDGIDLVDLTSALVEAALAAGREIRSVHSSGSLRAVEKGGGVDEWTGSEMDDLQTEADRRAEQKIVAMLHHRFPKLRVVGEEGFFASSSSPSPSSTLTSTLTDPLGGSLGEEGGGEIVQLEGGRGKEGAGEDTQVRLPVDVEALPYGKVHPRRLSCWVDPLDGTAEFVRGDLQSVTTLIGVALDGVPVAGVIAKPFGDAALQAEGEGEGASVLWALAGAGAFLWSGDPHSPHRRLHVSDPGTHRPSLEDGGPREAATEPRHVCCSGLAFEERHAPPVSVPLACAVTTRSRSTTALERALDKLSATRIVRAGGAGNKFWDVAVGAADVYVFPRGGTKRWDACAGEAILRAVGGVVSDVFGRPYRYYLPSPLGAAVESSEEASAELEGAEGIQNSFGLLASCGREGEDFHFRAIVPPVLEAVCEEAALEKDGLLAGWLEGLREKRGKRDRGGAWDIARLSDGEGITCEWLQRAVSSLPCSVLFIEGEEEGRKSGKQQSVSLGEAGWRVVDVEVRESEAIRFRLSEAVRLRAVLERQQGGEGEGEKQRGTASFFFKRMVPRDLPDVRTREEGRLQETVESALVEACFLSGEASALGQETGLRLPRLLSLESSHFPHSPLDSSFCTLMEDLSNPRACVNSGLRGEAVEQREYFFWKGADGGGRGDAAAVLDALARFHAFFWEGGGPFARTRPVREAVSEILKEPPSRHLIGEEGGVLPVWHVGSFWAMRDSEIGNSSAAVGGLRAFLDRWGDFVSKAPGGISKEQLEGLVTAKWGQMGQEILRLREKPCTAVHGDFKAANIFLPSGTGIFEEEADAKGEGLERPALIDFQWMGRGRPAFDLVYFMLSSVDPESLYRDEEMVRFYYERLSFHMGRLGGGRDLSAFSEDECLDEFRTVLRAFIARTVLGGAWPRFGVEFERREGRLSVAGYNKSAKVGGFAVQRMRDLLLND
uniref:3'(2'),5'-bisphosphate nucleotidase 1 n=1 Tax=Chromera velia CCMP2878 TaxID=1169474 RepID=A0A0G4IAH1_9ALVE|eukprot:Cvel_12515.t1-p1 / transcript=Cvel_12515.t1 / gene=Cvel_12515 / organism=Chromera_velia_CCMP2878 / gene_product=Inositol polyphosphate 1-phosphatase, putative / transcript_product=Inositol polyphosphate 1-phosphatase, putative / location=Cvel_scaffold821:42404-48411(-) / protein_length=1045 / sequence_SO=supercontig / SO=protein_coding / is_pseudo=false